MSWYR